jgi:dipeptidyl-peptidase-4
MMVWNKPFYRFLLISIFWFSVSFLHASAQGNKTYQSLQHALFSSGQLTGNQGPSNIRWIGNGNRYSYLEKNLQHFAPEIRVYDITTGKDSLLFHPAEHIFPHTSMPFNFDDYQWSEDESSILFKTNTTYQNSTSWKYHLAGSAEYYHFDLATEEITYIDHSSFNARLSPDGKNVGYHKNGEIFIHHIESGTKRKLTNSSEDNLYNGRFGWVYEDAFQLTQALKWSHSSRYMAFWQTDERNVNRLSLANYEGVYTEYNTFSYPKPGTNNPVVKIGILDVETGETQWVDLDGRNGLIPRIYWTSNPEELAVVWMNREQTEMKLYLYDLVSQEKRLVLEEKPEDGWIDIFSLFSDAKNYLFFPTDRNEFFWVSDSNGFNHIYRHDYTGNLVNQVTYGDWEVTQILAINTETETIYYESTEADPLERHLYSIRFDGTGKVQHSNKPGIHTFNMSPGGKYYFDRWSNTETPHKTELKTTQDDGRLIKTIVSNEAVEAYLEEYVYQPRELFNFTTEQGVKLDGYLIRPYNFDPDKSYPLVLMIYGGPGHQGVFNEFETSPWVQYLAQQGYVIANINNRGSSGYGREFKKSVHKQLGILEAEDYAAAAKHLSDQSWIDENRIAIRGHSYGGFMAALSAVLYPNVFKVSLVGAPVTDWRLYKSIYTERHMGLPDENRENYDNSSIMAHAHELKAKMLVAHSAMDQDVHIQNTMQMITAFTEAGKDIDLRIFPKGSHAVNYNSQSYLLLHQIYMDYLETHLK